MNNENLLNIDVEEINGNLSPIETISGNISDGDVVGGNISSEQITSGHITYGNGGSSDYNLLINKPSIEHVVLQNNKDFEDLGLMRMDASDILSILI